MILLLALGLAVAVEPATRARVIDGALGAEYLKELRHLLENPALLLI